MFRELVKLFAGMVGVGFSALLTWLILRSYFVSGQQFRIILDFNMYGEGYAELFMFPALIVVGMIGVIWLAKDVVKAIYKFVGL